MITNVAALADVPASFARENARLRIREIEERRGFPGALRTLGSGAISRLSPMSRLRSRAKARDYEYAK